MAHRELTSYTTIDEVFSQALQLSPADETELVWLERRHGQASSRPDAPCYLEPPRLTVLVRVVEKGRVGWHRTESGGVGDVEIALRQAMALATVQPVARRLPVLPLPSEEIVVPDDLFDPRIAGLDLDAARSQARALCSGSDEEAVVHWSQMQIAVVNSHGLVRQGEATEVTLTFRSGEGPLAGRAAGSARSLRELDAPAIVARARSRRTALPLGELPVGASPLFLSGEVTTELLNVVNIFALAGRAFLDGTSVLARHRNIQVFDRGFNLRDDPQAMPGLRFPFDFEGSRKRALDLVVEGKPILPALSQHQGGEAGMESTAQSVGGQDALFGNLFLLPGELDEQALIAEAEGGIFASWIERPECYEPSQLRIRGILRGVRAVRDGRLAQPLPDLLWEDGLLHAFGRLRAIGSSTVVRAMPSTPLGAIGAPPLVLADAAILRLLPETQVAARSQATVLSRLPKTPTIAAEESATGLHTWLSRQPSPSVGDDSAEETLFGDALGFATDIFDGSLLLGADDSAIIDLGDGLDGATDGQSGTFDLETLEDPNADGEAGSSDAIDSEGLDGESFDGLDGSGSSAKPKL